MPVKGTIADGFIKIALAGFEAAKAGLLALQTEAKKVSEAMGTIGTISAKGFAVATGGISAFLKAADPVRWTIFTQKLVILSMHIGSIFIPLLKEATRFVDRLTEAVKRLTPHQEEQILKWTKIVLAVLAVGTAIGILIKSITTLMAVLRALSIVVGILESETGIGLVLALVALGLAIYEVIRHSKEFAPVLDALENAWDTLVEAIQPVIDIFKQVFARMQEMWAIAIPKMVAVLQAVVHAFEKMIPPIMKIIEIFMGLYQTYFNAGQKVFADLMSKSGALIPLIQKLGHYLQDGFERFAKIMEAVRPGLEKLIEAFVELYGAIAELGMELLGDLIDSLADLGKSLWDVFGDTIIDSIKAMVFIIREMVREIKAIVDAAKEAYDIYKKVKERAGDLLDKLNPFSDGKKAERREQEKAKLEQERKTDDERDKKKSDERQKKKDEDNKKEKSRGLPPPGKVEMFGVEDAFRRAQKAAEYDPSKLSAMEQRKYADRYEALLDAISGNTTKKPLAEQIR